MTRYSDHVWLFPFGAAPDVRQPVQVFRNGLPQWMGEEVRLVRVGTKRPTTVAVLEPPTREGDVVQASYAVFPEVGR
jgi:hypothetical protein